MPELKGDGPIKATFRGDNDLPAVRLVYAPLTVTDPADVQSLEVGLGKLAQDYVLKHTERMHTYNSDTPGQTAPSQFGLAMVWVRRDLA